MTSDELKQEVNIELELIEAVLEELSLLRKEIGERESRRYLKKLLLPLL